MNDEYFCWNCCKNMEKPIVEPSFCSEECRNALEKEQQKEKEDFEEQVRKDNLVIEEAKKYLTEKQIQSFLSGLEDMEYICDFEFVDKPYGQKQKNHYEEWVDQRSVGDSGDCWTGEVYIKLSNGKYLKYHYDC